MDRSEAFRSLRDHAWLGRLYKRLTVQERDLAEAFLVDHAHLDRGAFEQAIARWGMDRPRTKNHLVIVELMSCANTLIGESR